jgi:hypothetical protein
MLILLDYLLALIEQSSNQILMDMKNIYEFRDIIEVSMNSSDIYQEIIDNNP